jgi:uncharacterized protein (UPF0548 family)
MFSLRKPTDAVPGLMAAQAESPFSYSAVGASAHQAPSGYTVDRTRTRLGEGEQAFKAAKRALQHWDHFRLGWLEAWPPDTPIETGQVISVVAHTFGMWSLHFSRIVYVIDESGPVTRFGFAYGTLAHHAERGEERFLVEWLQNDNSVWYDILAFSRPRHVLAWLGYPLVRRTQKRFARDSSSAMLRAVQAANSDTDGRAAAIYS